jgi:cytoskeletal protein CcmA (bactofilin family)
MLDINELKRSVTNKLSKDNSIDTDDQEYTEAKSVVGKPVLKSKQLAMIGPSIHFKGELTGEEGLIIDGSIEGTINLKGNTLIVGENGRIMADVFANTIKVDGHLQGELHGAEKVHVSSSGEVSGNIFSPRVVIEDGAKFKGSIDMTHKSLDKPAIAAKDNHNTKDNQLKSA